MGVTDLYIHTRPFADAYYRSELFPFSAYVSGIQGVDPGYDPLEYMVFAAHNKGMKIHAWLNPYRVANSTDLSLLADTNIAKIWLTDNNTENDRYVLEFEGRLYFNPTVPQVQKLVIDGVREILDNYDVDGIHLDDYFYPTTDEGFDKPEYDAYVALSSNPLSHDDWRRNNVNALVSGIYSAVHSGYDAVFGISPSAHISTDKTDTNYNEAYADIGLWMNSTGYIDYIAPQLYFGYNYPLDKMKFNNLLEVWCKMPRKSNIKMYIGIAAYKIGNSDAHSNEWIDETDILGRQTIDSYNAECDGIAIYSYSSLFNEPKLEKCAF